jgi:hypothetical protein
MEMYQTKKLFYSKGYNTLKRQTSVEKIVCQLLISQGTNIQNMKRTLKSKHKITNVNTEIAVQSNHYKGHY